MLKSKHTFTEQEEEEIVHAIRLAEKNTSGELRVHITQSKDENALESTKQIFNELKMFNTKDRNGVLIHLSIASKQFAIYGDIGIHTIVGDDFWNSTRDIMLAEFKNRKIAQGLVKGIEEVGIQLKEHFPYSKEDINELSDEITYS